MNRASDIELHDLTLGYDRHPAVHHLSGRIAAGSMLAVVGPNGGGKSTLLRGLVGELRPIGGRISGLAGAVVAYVPQQDRIDRSYPVTVFDLVAMGLWDRRGLFGGFGRRDDAAVAAALARVGLAGFERRPIGTLSGGQLQRALFARVTLQDAGVILLDEPFSAIDSGTVEDLMHVVHGWRSEGRTVVAVLHDLPLVRAHFPEALLLARSRIAWGPVAEALTEASLAAARGMREAFDDQAPLCEAPPASAPGGIARGIAHGHGGRHHHHAGHDHADHDHAGHRH